MSNKPNDSSVLDLLDSMPDLDFEETSSEKEYIHFDGIDPRIKMLSHSSSSVLHKCPRKFQLYRLSSMAQEQEDSSSPYGQLTLDFGTAVGHGIQRVFQGVPLDTIILEMFLLWSVDIEFRDLKRSKSFAEAVLAVQQFSTLRERDYLEEYELLYYEGAPAVELSFKTLLPEGFSYRGFIDVVLRHKLTGEILVIEDKTTYYKEINPAQYKNSGQALGYSVILDHLVPGLSSYTVLYLVYGTTRREFIELPFEKSSLQRAEWLTAILMDCKMIEMYEAFGLYPKNGDFCYDFYRECQYFGLCNLSTQNLVKPLTKKEWEKIQEKEEQYAFVFDFHDLVNTQIGKIE